MKSKSIFLASSMNFYQELVEIETKLTSLGYTVTIPVSARSMKQNNDFDVTHYKGVVPDSERAEFIRQNFEEIKGSDAILVINNEKNGVQGYIGANVLMEIGFAFFFRKKIYIWNPIAKNAPYAEELRIFGVEFINQDLGSMHV